MAATSQYIAMGGSGAGPLITKRAMRLAKTWLRLKAKPARIKELALDMECHWRTVYCDVVDLQLEPLEPGFVLMMVGSGMWAVKDIRQGP
ncbi:MAG: hypothetical protein WC565_05025 [Parcubacteria group bacterium]